MELPKGENTYTGVLELQPSLYYRASFGAGETPLSSEPAGPSVQLVEREEGSSLYLVVQELL